MTDNDSMHALTGAYVLDALEPGELTAFEAHLLVCPDCREEVRSVRTAVLRISAVSAVEPPPELRTSVLDAHRRRPPASATARADRRAGRSRCRGAGSRGRRPASHRPGRGARPPRRSFPTLRTGGGPWPPQRSSSPSWPWAGDCCATTTRSPVRPWRCRARARSLWRRCWRRRICEVYASGEDSASRGAVLRSEATGTAAAILQDLPGLQSGQVFQAWAIADEAPVSAGVFEAGDGATTSCSRAMSAPRRSSP